MTETSDGAWYDLKVCWWRSRLTNSKITSSLSHNFEFLWCHKLKMFKCTHDSPWNFRRLLPSSRSDTIQPTRASLHHKTLKRTEFPYITDSSSMSRLWNAFVILVSTSRSTRLKQTCHIFEQATSARFSCLIVVEVFLSACNSFALASRKQTWRDVITWAASASG